MSKRPKTSELSNIEIETFIKSFEPRKDFIYAHHIIYSLLHFLPMMEPIVEHCIRDVHTVKYSDLPWQVAWSYLLDVKHIKEGDRVHIVSDSILNGDLHLLITKYAPVIQITEPDRSKFIITRSEIYDRFNDIQKLILYLHQKGANTKEFVPIPERFLTKDAVQGIGMYYQKKESGEYLITRAGMKVLSDIRTALYKLKSERLEIDDVFGFKEPTQQVEIKKGIIATLDENNDIAKAKILKNEYETYGFIKRRKEYWGTSESGFNSRDEFLNYLLKFAFNSDLNTFKDWKSSIDEYRDYFETYSFIKSEGDMYLEALFQVIINYLRALDTLYQLNEFKDINRIKNFKIYKDENNQELSDFFKTNDSGTIIEQYKIELSDKSLENISIIYDDSRSEVFLTDDTTVHDVKTGLFNLIHCCAITTRNYDTLIIFPRTLYHQTTFRNDQNIESFYVLKISHELFHIKTGFWGRTREKDSELKEMMNEFIYVDFLQEHSELGTYTNFLNNFYSKITFNGVRVLLALFDLNNHPENDIFIRNFCLAEHDLNLSEKLEILSKVLSNVYPNYLFYEDLKLNEQEINEDFNFLCKIFSKIVPLNQKEERLFEVREDKINKRIISIKKSLSSLFDKIFLSSIEIEKDGFYYYSLIFLYFILRYLVKEDQRVEFMEHYKRKIITYKYENFYINLEESKRILTIMSKHPKKIEEKSSSKGEPPFSGDEEVIFKNSGFTYLDEEGNETVWPFSREERLRNFKIYLEKSNKISDEKKKKFINHINNQLGE